MSTVPISFSTLFNLLILRWIIINHGIIYFLYMQLMNQTTTWNELKFRVFWWWGKEINTMSAFIHISSINHNVFLGHPPDLNYTARPRRYHTFEWMLLIKFKLIFKCNERSPKFIFFLSFVLLNRNCDNYYSFHNCLISRLLMTGWLMTVVAWELDSWLGLELIASSLTVLLNDIPKSLCTIYSNWSVWA